MLDFEFGSGHSELSQRTSRNSTQVFILKRLNVVHVNVEIDVWAVQVVGAIVEKHAYFYAKDT